jgi:hypothetical protein
MKLARVALLAVALAACAHQPPPAPGEPPPPPSRIHCGTEALEVCAPAVLSGIYGCIDGTDDIVSCLMGSVVKPLPCAAFEVVACLVRGEGAKAEHLAQAEASSPIRGVMGPAGSTSWRRAARAKQFLERTGAKFDDPDPAS